MTFSKSSPVSPSNSGSGSCVICGQSNPRSRFSCQECGARLPWADANAAPPGAPPLLKERLFKVWVQIASFLIPILGVVLFFVYRTKSPKMARSAIQAAALGMALNLVLLIVTK